MAKTVTETKTNMDPNVVLKFDNVCKYFPVGMGILRRTNKFIYAMDHLSVEVAKGETLAVVGESGCGKTTFAHLALNLTQPTRGNIYVRFADGSVVDVNQLKKRRSEFRRTVQLIFQDPYESLNPRKHVFDTVVEPLVINKIGNIKERLERVRDVLAKVKLLPVDQYLFRFPHEMSGGQRQRVAIARTLVLDPRVIVADEPTSMLDIAVRTSIMRLMLDLQQEHGFSYIYITHDMGVARYMSDRTAVMYLGKIVELGATETVLKNPTHPYTRALLSAILSADVSTKPKEPEIIGSVSKPVNPPPHCRFLQRCPIAIDRCSKDEHPDLMPEGQDRTVACYNPQTAPPAPR